MRRSPDILHAMKNSINFNENNFITFNTNNLTMKLSCYTNYSLLLCAVVVLVTSITNNGINARSVNHSCSYNVRSEEEDRTTNTCSLVICDMKINSALTYFRSHAQRRNLNCKNFGRSNEQGLEVVINTNERVGVEKSREITELVNGLIKNSAANGFDNFFHGAKNR